MEGNKNLGSKNERGHNTNDIWGNCSKREIIESTTQQWKITRFMQKNVDCECKDNCSSKMHILVTTYRGKVLAPSVLFNVLLLKMCKVNK